MSKIKTITLYPNIHLEYNNHNCIVNYSYPKVNIPNKKLDKIKIDYYEPNKIESVKDLYKFLLFLNNKSGTQRTYIATTKQLIISFVFFLIGMLLAIPVLPLGIIIVLFSILGLIGFFNLLPKISVTSNLSKEDLSKVSKLIKYTYGYGKKNSKILENLNIEDGAKALLFSYTLKPIYRTNYEHETVSGAADKRYKNNSIIYTTTGYKLELKIPPKFYFNPSFQLNWHDDFIKEVEKINIEIKSIKVGIRIETRTKDNNNSFNQHFTDEAFYTDNIKKAKTDKTVRMSKVSPKSRLIALLLCLILGFFGVHNFYAGKKSKGFLDIFILCACLLIASKNQTFSGLLACSLFIFYLIDLVSIMIGRFTDNNNCVIKNWKIKTV